MSADLLQPQVRRLFASLTHAGERHGDPDDGDGPELQEVDGEAGRQQQGTRVRFILRVRGSRLIGARYYAYGCPHTLAVCEWLAERLEAGEITSLGTPLDWCEVLGVPIVKLGRLLIVEDALKAALAKVALAATLASENVVK